MTPSRTNNLLRSVDTKVRTRRYIYIYISRLHSGVAPPLPLDSEAYNKGLTLGNSQQQHDVDNCDADDGQGRDYRSRAEGSTQPSGPGEVLKGEIHG